MKRVNIVLSILILLLAAASAVFSYFLFEKRSPMVEGWKKMATAINQSAREMDKGSGTRVGDTLTGEALSHEHYAELDQKLAQLTKQSQALVKQRDILAASLQKIGGIVEMKSPPEVKALQEMATYSTARNAVSDGAGDLVSRRDKIAGTIVNTSRANLQLEINLKQVQAANQTELGKFTERMNQFGKEYRDFENALAEIYRQCGGQGSLNFSGNDFSGELNKGKQAVRAMKEKLDETNRNITMNDQKIQHQIGQINLLNGQLASVTDKFNEKKYQFERLHSVLGLKEKPIPGKWGDGSPEARKLAIGRVVDVSTKYGYILIDLGTESTVHQQRGDEDGDVNIAMAKGLEMIVSRGELEVPTSEFITKVKITNVDKNCSIAEPFGDQNGTVEVGDKVWFDIK